MNKYVYSFGGGTADGDGSMKEVLGGKGASLSEMSRAGIPAPPGFAISTEVCNIFLQTKNSIPRDSPRGKIDSALARPDQHTGKELGDASNPLVFSIPPGATIKIRVERTTEAVHIAVIPSARQGPGVPNAQESQQDESIRQPERCCNPQTRPTPTSGLSAPSSGLHCHLGEVGGFVGRVFEKIEHACIKIGPRWTLVFAILLLTFSAFALFEFKEIIFRGYDLLRYVFATVAVATVLWSWRRWVGRALTIPDRVLLVFS